MGRVDVAFDENGVVQTDKSNLSVMPIDEHTEENAEAKQELDQFKSELEDVKNEKVGYTDVALDGTSVSMCARRKQISETSLRTVCWQKRKKKPVPE
nr:hypothetical protein P5668_22285 [Bacillus subtilis]